MFIARLLMQLRVRSTYKLHMQACAPLQAHCVAGEQIPGACCKNCTMLVQVATTAAKRLPAASLQAFAPVHNTCTLHAQQLKPASLPAAPVRRHACSSNARKRAHAHMQSRFCTPDLRPASLLDAPMHFHLSPTPQPR